MTLVEVLFGLLGVVALAAGLLVVTTRQLVHAALWLVVCLGAVAGCYLLLSAEFVALVQVLIYVGAVVVLLLFGAKRLPEIGSSMGKGIREFRKASSDLEESVRGEPKRPVKDDQPAGEQAAAPTAEATAPTASTPSLGMKSSAAPKWNNVGHEPVSIWAIIDGTPEP
mgnify:CR=1 FL=1